MIHCIAWQFMPIGLRQTMGQFRSIVFLLPWTYWHILDLESNETLKLNFNGFP